MMGKALVLSAHIVTHRMSMNFTLHNFAMIIILILMIIINNNSSNNNYNAV